jgi:Plant transposon protein
VLARSRHGGSRVGKRPNRDLGRRSSAVTLDRDYFCRMPEHAQLAPMFTCNEFERRYRMQRSTYEVLRETVIQEHEYSGQRYDACGVAGLTTDQELYCALRQLSLGIASDAVTEYAHVSESTASNCLKRFCVVVVRGLQAEYLRLPTMHEISEIESQYAALGFPGCIGCADVASWAWDNCPTSWQGMYKRKDGKPCGTRT